ncbi:PEPxxWA-CTERM sorting domain-containing protein [Phenylobacterium sp.]|uniref:PEPxxWA-CTERM sorting domain-containing protein n=1 Tax=Phenylobacterium sp. TaxID=1871053 RepID=UPI002C167178|nr:PEPxxWA-CTERM sorting domain-containing protein [Phenylobacterium sp.]HLZ73860.1 PEPxxWA-CTERM sorting domain-containing protein [Phenylobacterium sp.]
MFRVPATAARLARLAPAAAGVAALIAVASPARANDPAYGIWTQLHVEAGAGVAVNKVSDSGLTQAAAPITYTLTAFASGGGASAASTATATSFYGYLDVAASGSASPSPTNGAGSSFSADVGGFPVDYFRDQIFVQPGALPVGSLVQLGFTIDYGAGSASAVTDPASLQPSRAALSTDFHLTDLDTAVTIFDIPHGLGAGVDSFTVMVPVGQRLRLEGSLVASGSASSTFADTSFSVTDPTTIHFDAITPGLDLTTASGHDYGLAGVPEPDAWALLLVGFGGLGAALRARRGRLAAIAS